MNGVCVEHKWGEMVTKVFWWVEVYYIAGGGSLSLIAIGSKKMDIGAVFNTDDVGYI